MINKKILVFTRSAWRDDLNTGLTLSNLFDSYEGDLFNFYLKDQTINNKIVKKSFNIYEKKLLGFNNKTRTKIQHIDNPKELNSYFIKFIVDIFWFIFFNKNNKIFTKIKEEKPEIIFMPLSEWMYTLRILNLLKLHLPEAKVVLFHTDDNLSHLYQSTSLFNTFYRKLLRYYLKKAIKKADINYCITEKQIEVYKNVINEDIKFKLLHKGAIDITDITENVINKVIRITYAGNLQYGRELSIFKLSEYIESFNLNNDNKIYLDIYTKEIKSQDLQRLIATSNYVNKKDFLNYKELLKVLNESHFALHIESFEKKFKLLTALSFSTKIVDYLSVEKPIISYGWNNSASIDFIIKNDIGYLINNISDFKNVFDSELYTRKINKIRKLNNYQFNMKLIKQKLYNDINL